VKYQIGYLQVRKSAAPGGSPDNENFSFPVGDDKGKTRYITVDKIYDDGAVAAWNRQCTDRPILVGDRIISVNEFTAAEHGPNALLQECKRSRTIRFSIERAAEPALQPIPVPSIIKQQATPTRSVVPNKAESATITEPVSVVEQPRTLSGKGPEEPSPVPLPIKPYEAPQTIHHDGKGSSYWNREQGSGYYDNNAPTGKNGMQHTTQSQNNVPPHAPIGHFPTQSHGPQHGHVPTSHHGPQQSYIPPQHQMPPHGHIPPPGPAHQSHIPPHGHITPPAATPQNHMPPAHVPHGHFPPHGNMHPHGHVPPRHHIPPHGNMHPHGHVPAQHHLPPHPHHMPAHSHHVPPHPHHMPPHSHHMPPHHHHMPPHRVPPHVPHHHVGKGGVPAQQYHQPFPAHYPPQSDPMMGYPAHHAPRVPVQYPQHQQHCHQAYNYY